jgi:hypothetical protein
LHTINPERKEKKNLLNERKNKGNDFDEKNA